MMKQEKVWMMIRIFTLLAVMGAICCGTSFADDFGFSVARVREALAAGMEPPAVKAPAVAAVRPSSARSIFRGRIKEISLAGAGTPKDLQGTVTVETAGGEVRSFLVSIYTFILVIDLDNLGYAGELRQLEPGWSCDVAYDVPENDDADMDLAGKAPGAELKFADNMTVYYRR